MTKLETAVRMFIDDSVVEHKGMSFRSYTEQDQSKWWRVGMLRILDAIEEIDNRQTTTKMGTLSCVRCYKIQPHIEGEDPMAFWARHGCAPSQTTMTLTDTQRRMGLRSTRHISGPEYNSDVD